MDTEFFLRPGIVLNLSDKALLFFSNSGLTFRSVLHKPIDIHSIGLSKTTD